MPDAQELGGVADDFERELVAVGRGLVDGLGGDLPEVAAYQRPEPALGAGLELLDRPERDVGTRGVGLEAAVVAALAAPAFGIDRGVADLARHVRGSVVQPAVEDDAASDAGADRNADGVPRAARRADPPLAEHRAVGVVVERGRQAEPVVNDLRGAAGSPSRGWA